MGFNPFSMLKDANEILNNPRLDEYTKADPEFRQKLKDLKILKRNGFK